MARTITCDARRRTAYEPLYDIDPQTGATIEVFFADQWLAKSFGTREGWFWWTCQRGFLPGGANWPVRYQLHRISRRTGGRSVKRDRGG